MPYNKRLVFDPEGGIPRLIEIMRQLRDPNFGCPWDLEQDFFSIAPYTIEEAYEVVDAIEQQNWQELKNELGDLLLQTVFHSQLANEANLFSFEDVVNQVCNKMITRHPHVFGDNKKKKSADEQIKDWETQKEVERVLKDKKGTLDDVALALPALKRAIKLQIRAARVGFDWTEIDKVLDKIIEECEELICARKAKEQKEIFEEFGDLLFTIVNLGRHLKVDPEDALRAANSKFVNRFSYIENNFINAGNELDRSNLADMERLWEEAKLLEKK